VSRLHSPPLARLGESIVGTITPLEEYDQVTNATLEAGDAYLGVFALWIWREGYSPGNDIACLALDHENICTPGRPGAECSEDCRADAVAPIAQSLVLHAAFAGVGRTGTVLAAGGVDLLGEVNVGNVRMRVLSEKRLDHQHG
jgi:hypothetical protein